MCVCELIINNWPRCHCLRGDPITWVADRERERCVCLTATTTEDDVVKFLF